MMTAMKKPGPTRCFRVAPLLLVVALAACQDGGYAGADSAPLVDADPRLSIADTGLYADVANKVVAPGVVSFAPAWALWSDAAEKSRWILLPPNAQIDSIDMDKWQFPVGAKLFKEFVRDGVLVETRLIERTGPGAMDFWMGAFVWTLDESNAFFAEAGEQNANGTPHDVPSAARCWNCHGGEPARVLGFSAVQLSHAGPGLTLADVAQNGWLTQPPAPNESFAVPGDAAIAAPALGYLHANCGHCHNPNGGGWVAGPMVLRVGAAESAGLVAQTELYMSTVDVPTSLFNNPNYPLRIARGDAAASAIPYRMSVRGGAQMPPVGNTEDADPAGLARVGAWINNLL